MRICILRHGETDWNAARRLQGRTDVPLNENGRAQADAAGEHLRTGNWQAIITSPLSRAKHTALRIADALCLDPSAIIEDPRLIERDYGQASGLTPEQRNEQFPSGNYLGMEPFESLQSRLTGAFWDICRTHQGKNVLIVCHGGATNALLHALSGGELGTGKTRLLTGAMNTIELTDGRATILKVNEIPS